MSWKSFFVVYAVPNFVEDPDQYTEPLSLCTGGGSRSGWFEWKCELLMDMFPGHDALRFLYDRSRYAGRDVGNEGGASWQLLRGHLFPEITTQIESLLGHCGEHIGDLPFEYYSVADSHEALSSAMAIHELPEHISDGDEGDSPQFLFSALASLLMLFKLAHEGDQSVVYYTCIG